MTPRALRRAAERKAKKAARKAARVENQPQATPKSEPVAAPRANNLAGPNRRQPAPTLSSPPVQKATRAKPSLRKTAATTVSPAPSKSCLRNDLRKHYYPADIVEQGYVDRLAEHMWLRRRCLDLQIYCFDAETEYRFIDDEKQFALLARYQSQNERGMDKCVNMLEKFRAAHKKE